MSAIVIHGHFYQPPRENPWTGFLDRETSAHPFPNWNTRILEECYARNAAVPLSAASGPAGVADNYRSLSFDFGPTLLDWLHRESPGLIEDLRQADRAALSRAGHGNAIAHGYNHAILPLLAPRDRRTQIRWGIAHFRHVFRREPEGFWLPETAADDATLQALAEEGIRFTVLSPGQLGAVRPEPASPWRREIRGEDLGQAYRYRTRDAGELALFFYDGTVAGEMAFGHLLDDGRALADRLRQGLAERSPQAPLFAVALDGESFGHHHRRGAEALADAVRLLRSDGIVPTDFASFLDSHPPRAEALIREPGSWSCDHGVERWRDHCGCTTGGHPGWNQAWRRPLFEAIRALGAGLASVFDEDGGRVLRDPWSARDAYIDLLLEPEEDRRRDFLSDHARRGADPERVWSILEMERHALLMFTSCGWFFDDPARLETRQVLRYAARALEFCPEPAAGGLLPPFLDRLGPLRSNKDPELDGARLYMDAVKTGRSGYSGSVQYEDPPEPP